MRTFVAILTTLALLSLGGTTWAQETCSDSVYALVDEIITVVHSGALYNCCPEFAYDVWQEGNLITVVESEIEAMCFCVCCFDLRVEVGGIPPGDYQLDFHWFDYESNDWQVWTLDINVPGMAPPQHGPFIAGFDRSDCGGATVVTEGEQDSATWGVIKALYR